MLDWIKSLTLQRKRVIILSLDCMLMLSALAFAVAAQDLPGGVARNFGDVTLILPYLLALTVILSTWLGVDSIRLNSYETAAVGLTAILAICVAASAALLSELAGLDLPVGLHLVFGAAFFSLVVISRAMLLHVVLTIYRRSSPRCRVLIYGAGNTGTQLVSALRSHENIEPVAFVDDNMALQGLKVARLPVYSPTQIAEIAQDKKIDRVLLALPSLSLPKQSQIVRRLETLGLEVQALPSFSQLIGEEALVDKLTPAAHAFLNRDEVDQTLLEGADCYAGKVVMVTGAGGSIGSELCRQILACRPAKLLLFELGELALYNVDMELRHLAEGSGVGIVPILGSHTDVRLVKRAMKEHRVQIVVHAAAYKHVPLVEGNALAGLVNNVFGTQTLAHQARHAGVERFILISSDKAVRPTNIMGASKRLAEMVVQDLARSCAGRGTIFSMVRFGNVLGSSGSVVPLFQDQLSRGGPLTVTHRSVERYFMTVHEAVRLVLQAGAMATGGEVFVLDMGKPVPIMQLARQVIESAGYTVRDDDNPDGDIEIEITGLRPGEKLTEELTLSGRLTCTQHPKIFAAKEECLSEIEVALALRSLREAFLASNEDMARDVVQRWVEGYRNWTRPQVMRG